MRLLSLTILCVLLFGAFSVESLDIYRHLGYFERPYCAFASIDTYKGETALFITSFGGIPGAIDYVPSIGSKMSSIPSISPTVITSDVIWPNQAAIAPIEVFGPDHLVSVGGFLVPGFRTGEVLVFDLANNTEYKISEDEKGFFYHTSTFFDVDEDGLLDLVTAKTDYPAIGPAKGRLVWFKNPGVKTFPWKENLLFNGPDVYFQIVDIDNDGKLEVVASIFFNERMSIFHNKKGAFADTAAWTEVVIDDAMGAPFHAIAVDLNNDRKLEILATNHQDKVEESAVFVYEVPADITTEKFTRHVIATGFETTQPGEGQGSPGEALAFHAQLNRTDEKPLIMVSGDGTQRAHLLRPNSEDPNDWTYTMETVMYFGNTVGGISMGDVDNDGWIDFFIPNYDDGQIHAMTFAPY